MNSICWKLENGAVRPICRLHLKFHSAWGQFSSCCFPILWLECFLLKLLRWYVVSTNSAPLMQTAVLHLVPSLAIYVLVWGRRCSWGNRPSYALATALFDKLYGYQFVDRTVQRLSSRLATLPASVSCFYSRVWWRLILHFLLLLLPISPAFFLRCMSFCVLSLCA